MRNLRLVSVSAVPKMWPAGVRSKFHYVDWTTTDETY